jgi:hypothetical protein
MALDADAAWPLKWEVSFLLNQADVAPARGLFLAQGSPMIALLFLLAGIVVASCAMRVDAPWKTVLLAVAKVVAWVWALVAGVGGLALLIHQGPLPITNGWFALFSGAAACPLTGMLFKRYADVTISIRTQLAIALLIFIAGRIAVVVLLHRPFMPQ